MDTAIAGPVLSFDTAAEAQQHLDDDPTITGYILRTFADGSTTLQVRHLPQPVTDAG